MIWYLIICTNLYGNGGVCLPAQPFKTQQECVAVGNAYSAKMYVGDRKCVGVRR